MEREYKPKRRKRRRKKIVAAALFMLVVLTTAAVVCLAMFFNITDITAIGVSRYTPQEIVEASGILVDQNIFAVDTKKVAKELTDRFPYIQEAKVSRVLPTSVEIHITEAEPVVTIVNSQESYTLLSETGRVLEQGEGVSGEGLPLVVGTDFSRFPVGSFPAVLTEEEKEQDASGEAAQRAERCEEIMVTIRRVTEAVEETGFENINYIDVSDELCTVLLYDDRAILKIGSELELNYKLAMAAEILDNQLGESFEGTVDLTVPPKAYTLEKSITNLVNQDYWNAY